MQLFFLVSLMICKTPSVSCGQRSVSTPNDPYGSNGSLALRYPRTKHQNSLPNDMHFTIRNLRSMERKHFNDPYGSNGSLTLRYPRTKHQCSLPNDMQNTIHQLWSTERKHTKRSVRIERIVGPSIPTH